MKAWMALLMLLPMFAGCLDGDPQSEPTPAADVDSDGDGLTDAEEIAIGDDPFRPFLPRVVVAIIDTGVTPYHDEFRQVRAGEDGFAHPSTYLAGYPSDVAAVPITLQMPDDEDPSLVETESSKYLEADEALWQETGSETLYWIPGTKFVGMYGMCTNLPGSGHGAMTSGRAGGNTISAGGNGTLLVHVRAPLSLEVDADGDSCEGQATRWTADQPWIDIQSHSWGNFVQCGDIAYNQLSGWSEAFQYARDRQLVFVAAANGYGNSGTLGYPSHCQSNAGVAGVVTVSATDNQGYASWSNWFPAIAADGCANPAVRESTTNELANTGGGTSSATPYSAGAMAKVILESRRIFRDPGVGIHDGVVATLQAGGTTPDAGPLADGVFTMDEAKAVLFHTARSPPEEDPSDGDACLNQIPSSAEDPGLAWFPFVGYGEVNPDTVAHAIEVIAGRADEPVRAQEDDLYARDQDARRQFWG